MSDWPVFQGPPGMRIYILPGEFGPRVHSLMDVADADQPDRTVVTSSVRPLDQQELRNDRDRFELAREVYAQAAAHWMHEFDEWFRMDGVRLCDPHEASNVRTIARKETS